MSSNVTLDQYLTLEDLGLSSTAEHPALIFGSLMYIITLAFNCIILFAIFASKKLHKPMFMLLCNLPISDIMGSTALFPYLLSSIATSSRIISYDACMIQAFFIHFYGTANLLTLSTMAYDRYVAICVPLRYHAIMTTCTLVKLILFIWFFDLAILGSIMVLNLMHTICRTHIVDLYCNNPSLLKLACGSTLINNYYGLFGIAVLQGGSVLVVIYTYVQIARTCVMTKQAEVRKKASQTCTAHLVSFLILQINTLVALSAHRARGASPMLRRAMGLSVVIFPPFLDPFIYGLSTKELKTAIVLLLRRRERKKTIAFYDNN